MQELLITALGGLLGGVACGRAWQLAQQRARDRGHKPPSQSELDAARLRATLQGACDRSQSAVVVVVASATVSPCRLSEVTDDTLSLTLEEGPLREHELEPKTIVMVQFNDQQRTRVFSVPVIMHLGPKLILSTPLHIANAELRSAYRIVLPPRTVMAALLHETVSYECYASDISVTGLGLVFPEDGAPDLTEGDEVEIRVRSEGGEIQRTGNVVRAAAPNFAIVLQPDGDRSTDEIHYRELVRTLSESVAA